MRFPVGYHHLHHDIGMNFQMNRWFGWVGEFEMLEEMREAAFRIKTYDDWKREFVTLAERASSQGHVLRAGFYWRSAEFFMEAQDLDRKGARAKFLDAMESTYALDLGERHAVPYTDGSTRGVLPAYRLVPPRPKCTIVFFGGFDSSIEEMTPAFVHLRKSGYDVIAFDGPGQGGALEAGLAMTPEWHKPVSAVLDYFEIERATLIGLSLGGCLAIRAAAGEHRVERVVAYDVLTDFLEVNLRQTNAVMSGILRALLGLRASCVVNWIVARFARTSPIAQWGIQQGMRVTGTTTPFDFLQRIREFATAGWSASVGQDCLLLAGSEDHYVRTNQWHRQIRTLTNARSITARLFTRSESAENHCQVGNYGLALSTIISWLDEMVARSATP